MQVENGDLVISKHTNTLFVVIRDVEKDPDLYPDLEIVALDRYIFRDWDGSPDLYFDSDHDLSEDFEYFQSYSEWIARIANPIM